MDEDLGVTRIRLEGDWGLEMVGEVSRTYVQIYAASCFLLTPSSASDRDEIPAWRRYDYPWRGGYSAVNFFRAIIRETPWRYRPEVLEISYASPGFIELLGYGLAISFVVRTMTVNASRVLGVCADVQKFIVERKLNKLTVQQREAQTRFIVAAYERLSDAMALPPEAKAKLQSATGQDSWGRLKILLSFGRRIRKLGNFSESGMVGLEEAYSLEKALSKHPSPDKVRKITEKAEVPLLPDVRPRQKLLLRDTHWDDDGEDDD